MRNLLMAGAVAALALLPGRADAVIINAGDIGLNGTTNINGVVGGVLVPGLTSSLFLQFSGTSNGGLTYNFAYTFTNTTSGTLVSEASAFGLNTTPNVVSATATGLFSNALVSANLPSVGVIDFCSSAGPTCGGGGSNGLEVGESASGLFSLTFASVLPFITLDAAFARYQAISGVAGGVTYSDASGAGTNNDPCVGCTPFLVPGPIVGAGLPGLITACLGLWGLHRRRRRLA